MLKSRLSVLAGIALTLCVAMAFPFPATADAAMFGFFRKKSGKNAKKGTRNGGWFPQSGDVADLEPIGKMQTYKGSGFQELYGAAGNRYIEYGLTSMMSADYSYGANDGKVSLEIATMTSPTAAAGLFHYHRGKILKGQGESVDVGAEGLVDTAREGRNLYFYRSNLFVKIVYSGKGKAPSLLPIAEYVDSHLPTGLDAKPDGFEYIDVEGIAPETIALTNGYAFSLPFLPPAVRASAPAGGSPASDLFICTKPRDSEAEEMYTAYNAYLRLHAEYHEEYQRDGMKFTKGVDPNQGRVLFTNYRNALIIAARPDGYEKGEALIERVMAQIDETRGASQQGEAVASKSGGKVDKAQGEEKAPRKRRGLFGIFRRNRE